MSEMTPRAHNRHAENQHNNPARHMRLAEQVADDFLHQGKNLLRVAGISALIIS